MRITIKDLRELLGGSFGAGMLLLSEEADPESSSEDDSSPGTL